jgi:hypothetical protein
MLEPMEDDQQMHAGSQREDQQMHVGNQREDQHLDACAVFVPYNGRRMVAVVMTHVVV